MKLDKYDYTLELEQLENKLNKFDNTELSVWELNRKIEILEEIHFLLKELLSDVTN